MRGHQLFGVPLVLLLGANIACDAASAKGGTLHLFSSEARAAIVSEPVVSPSVVLAGCGRGRYREPTTQKCRGPAEIGR
jgi:hypothetical protein